MPLREIIYLDRDRVHSYISQLTGGVTVQEVADASADKKLSGQISASIAILNFEVAGEKGSGSSFATTRIPVHHVLAVLEKLLRDEGILADAAAGTVLPGQIAFARGDATFESWELLATLADSVQGVATMAAKIYAATRGETDLAKIRQQVQQLDKLVKKYGHRSEHVEPTQQLGRAIVRPHTGLSIVDAGYVNDVKEIVKLFFQDQTHFRIASGGRTFVGLLRRENLVGCTMEELMFTYGAKPKANFGALFYVSEFGREEELQLDEIGDRFKSIAAQPFSFGMLQSAIREIGSVLLECAEELRRPIGQNAAFVVPLAIYRDIKAADGVGAAR